MCTPNALPSAVAFAHSCAGVKVRTLRSASTICPAASTSKRGGRVRSHVACDRSLQPASHVASTAETTSAWTMSGLRCFSSTGSAASMWTLHTPLLAGQPARPRTAHRPRAGAPDSQIVRIGGAMADLQACHTC